MILDLLKQDARRTVSEIATVVGLSRTTVKERIDLMRDRGIIRRFTVETDDAQPFADPLERAFFLVRLKRPMCRVVYAGIRHWPELIGCWSIAGDLDMVVLVDGASNSEIERLRDILARHPEVLKLQTLPVLRDWLYEGTTLQNGARSPMVEEKSTASRSNDLRATAGKP